MTCIGCNAPFTGRPHFVYCADCGRARRLEAPARPRVRSAARVVPYALDAQRRVDGQGYVRVSFGKRWKYEHRLVMEQQIGRALDSHEAVHHVNEDRSDNRPENLVLMTRSEHTSLHNRLAPKRARTRHEASTDCHQIRYQRPTREALHAAANAL